MASEVAAITFNKGHINNQGYQMLLYLDTLKKKDVLPKKKEKCHFILTSYDCDFVFVYLVCCLFWGWKWE